MAAAALGHAGDRSWVPARGRGRQVQITATGDCEPTPWLRMKSPTTANRMATAPGIEGILDDDFAVLMTVRMWCLPDLGQRFVGASAHPEQSLYRVRASHGASCRKDV